MAVGERHRPSQRATAGPPSGSTVLASARTRFTRRRWRGRVGRWKTLLLVLVVAALVGGAAWVLWFSAYVRVDEVAIQGLDRLSEATVRSTADVPVGEPLIRVDLDAATERLQALAPVASVEVSRAWPHTVRITVTERQPVAVLAENDTYRALDRDGVVFRRFPDPPPGLPLVRADELAAAVKGPAGAARADALREVAAVVEALDASVARRVDHVEVASLDAIELVLRDGVRVRWGSAADSAAKAEVLTAVMRVPASAYDVSVPSMPTTSG